jgi:hypothetical protein
VPRTDLGQVPVRGVAVVPDVQFQPDGVAEGNELVRRTLVAERTKKE